MIGVGEREAANLAAAAGVNRAASAPSLLLFRVRLPRLSGKPLDVGSSTEGSKCGDAR